MTKLLERAIEQAKLLPNERQDEVGEMILSLIEQDASAARLSPEQEAEVRRRLSLPRDIVPDDEMKAFFRSLTG
jgi:hypothetical protein